MSDDSREPQDLHFSSDHGDPRDAHNLFRFLEAQRSTYGTALAELKAGRKRSHWMWFIFPQVKGLGFSWNSEHYGIGSLDEARTYLKHPVLGARLIECAEALLAHQGLSATRIMGTPDDLKLRSSLTLFSTVSERDSPFYQALEHYFGGRPDERTLAIVASWTQADRAP